MSESQLSLDDLFAKALAAASTKQDFDTQFPVFVDYIREITKTYYTANFKHVAAPEIGYDDGKRYVRIWKKDSPSSRSAWGFVDKTNGNILKADGWKRPAPQPRGNIYDQPSWAKWVSHYGPAYLKR